MNPVNDLLFLVFPEICAVCGTGLWKYEEVICTSCNFHLPKTNFHLDKKNQVCRAFWGRVPIENAGAYLYFNKGSKVQRLIHQLKYKGRKDIGIYLGKQYGNYLITMPEFQQINYIVPVPLHRKKLKLRGYNQSESFAEGLSLSMKIPVDTSSFIRTISTQTQTRKSRFKRWENVSEIFLVANSETLENKHILLVDDVITTGATIESCVATLLKVSGIKISVAAIAFTRS